MCKCVKRKCAKCAKNRRAQKCANLQRKYFSKCRNHKSAQCTKTQMQISAEFTILSSAEFFPCKFSFLCVELFYKFIT